MPEGDTLHRIARNLAPRFEGHEVVAAEARSFDASRLIGSHVLLIEARGKHLLMHFDNGCIVHTHLGMRGSWHVYREGEAWKRAREQAVVALSTADWSCACFDTRTVALLNELTLRHHPMLSRLGPDPLRADFDVDAAVAGLRAFSETPIGVAVMKQEALSGVGNVYKSELLFREGINPFALVRELPVSTLQKFVDQARKWLSHNLNTRGRTLTGIDRNGARHFVYMRSGQRCVRCGDAIRMERQGVELRSTYFCPTCQSVDESRRR